MNRSKYSKYTKTVGQYFSASLIPMILSLAINPLIALNMTPEDYAITGYYTSFSTLFSPLVLFYMLHFYTKRFFEVDEYGRELLRGMLVKSLVCFSGLLAIVCLMGLYIYQTCFNNDSSMQFFPYAVLAILTLPLTGVYNLMLCDMRMLRESGRYMKISVISGVILSISTLLFVVLIKGGAFGKLLAPFISNIVLFVLGCSYYKKYFLISFDWQQFKNMLSFCFPLTIAAMLTFFSNGYDRVLLERLGDTNELGYYSVGLMMASYISVFQNAIGNTFQPDLFQSIVQKDKKKLMRVVALLIGSTGLIVLVYVIAAPLIVKILTAGRYMLSVKYTQIISLSILTSAMYYAVSQITIALGKTKVTLFTKILTTVLCIAMFSYLITNYQYVGAAWGVVVSFIISLLVNLTLIWISNIISEKKCH